VNSNDEASKDFLSIETIENKLPYALSDVTDVKILPDHSTTFTYKNTSFQIHIAGLHMVENAIASIKLAESLGIPLEKIADGLATLKNIPGRGQVIYAGQPYTIVVDYAHTEDSLRAIYSAYEPKEGGRKIAVLGSAGGGRDVWKRPRMGAVAGESCDTIIITNEDPYDESPENIMRDVAQGVLNKSKERLFLIEDRKEAIRQALSIAKDGDVIFLTGKGSESAIMGPKGTKITWSEEGVVRELLNPEGVEK
jgi:UDP-N-acetylmuramoyl-L-alanyl-D-glutamate--2,6-diaminopimelate ligase